MSPTTVWTREHLAGLEVDPATCAPLITRVKPMLAGHHLWDPWPVRSRDGGQAEIGGTRLWIALSAPRSVPPAARHDIARIRLLEQRDGTWSDLGRLFPEGTSLGSREWAGFAELSDDGRRVEVLYTAAGRSGETVPSYVQRIVATSAVIAPGVPIRLDEWEEHREVVTPGAHYRSTLDQLTGEPGFIKAFRDPFLHRDHDRGEHLLFTASLPASATGFDGAVGLARRTPRSGWEPLPPLIHADGVNNELERPHLVAVDGRLYLFFSTQARTFHPEVEAPTGLYGFVADDLGGPWAPLNGTGLVLRNPPEEPYQGYSWMVLPDLSVVSFVDFHMLQGRTPDEVEESGGWQGHFGGTFAPILRISLDGDRSRLVEVDGAPISSSRRPG